MKFFRPGFICRPPLLVVWNQQAKTSNIDLTNSLKTATCNATAAGAVAATKFRNTGKWYCELNGSAIGGGDTGMGLAAAEAVLNQIGSTVQNAMVQFRSGNVYSNGSVVFSNGNMSGGGILRVAYDADAHRAWFAFQAGSWNASAGNDPATGVGGVNTSGYDSSFGLTPVFVVSVSGDTCVGNWGATSFSFAAPSGFQSWNLS